MLPQMLKMDSPETREPHISTEYYGALQNHGYDYRDLAKISDAWDYAHLNHQPGEYMPYVRLGEYNEAEKPVFYVPGFTEGIEAKAPFGAEMAKAGFDVIIPGQNRKSILKDAADKKDATYTQALNYLAAIEAEGLHNQPLDVVTHSYGSLIFEDMLREAKDRGWTCFDEAEVALLAPAGTNENESAAKLGGRFGQSIVSETSKKNRDFPDNTGEMLQAGTANFTANIPRAAREIIHLFRQKVDYEYLTANVAKAAIFSYGNDKLFPFKVHASASERLGELGVNIATPYSQKRRADGTMRGADYATHNDEQFNPERVVGALKQFFSVPDSKKDLFISNGGWFS